MKTKCISHTFSTNPFASWSLVVYDEDTGALLAGDDCGWYLTRERAIRGTAASTQDPEILNYLSKIVLS